MTQAAAASEFIRVEGRFKDEPMIIALIITAVSQYALHKFLASQNIFVSSTLSVYTLVAAALVLILLSWVNNRSIKKYIRYNSF